MPDDDEGPPKRFKVELFIVHPSVDPAEISAALGLKARFVHPVGAQRRTPKGTLLPGTYPDTRWRHVRRYETTGQWVKDRIAELVEYLEPHRAYLAKLRDSGGRACVILAFLGDGYFGDTIPRSLLERLAELGLDLGIECFTVPQNERVSAS